MLHVKKTLDIVLVFIRTPYNLVDSRNIYNTRQQYWFAKYLVSILYLWSMFSYQSRNRSPRSS